MRHSVWIVVLMVLAMAVPVLAGEDVKALRKEMADLTRKIRTAERKAWSNEDVKALRKAATDAQKELMKAASEIAEIKEVDQKLGELRKQQGELMKQRNELMKKNAEVLAEPKKKVAEAHAAVKKAISELPEMKPLIEKQTELKAKLKAASGARKPRTRKPRDKKPRVRKPKPAAGGGGEM